MKKLFFATLPFLIFSCSEKSNDSSNSLKLTKSADATYSLSVIDTIMVDSGEEIIYMDSNKSRTDFSDDGKWYYNYNRKEHAIEVVDLEKAKLEKKLYLEKEGPNGTGPVEMIDFNDNGQFLIFNEKSAKVYDSNSGNIKLLKLKDFDREEEYSNLSNNFGELNDDGNIYYSLYQKEAGEPLGITKINFNDNTLFKKSIEDLDAIKAYRIRFNKMAVYPSLSFNKIGNKILLSNQTINELFVYDLEMKLSKHFTYQSDITIDQRTKPSKNEADSKEEFDHIRKSRPLDAIFGPMQFDPIRKQYYRLSLAQGKNENNFHKVLTVFDEKFNQLLETDRVEYNGILNNCFVRDGKIYTIENINDEMAFVVLKIQEI
ncbi:DUF4221 family protein [Echinicola sp. 20G]|uniref:DUF4221 family protein n=1 Tax=Echinicola sp. 20G TaxID=2781961 RepID=UPI001910A514|nr:DUF4221 family protein [Echinicola sp. 20G]